MGRGGCILYPCTRMVDPGLLLSTFSETCHMQKETDDDVLRLWFFVFLKKLHQLTSTFSPHGSKWKKASQAQVNKHGTMRSCKQRKVVSFSSQR